MYKIKKPHNCNKHWQIISQIFQGFEHHPLAITEEGKLEPIYGMLIQCSICKQVAVVPYKPNDIKTDATIETTKEKEVAEEINESGNQEGQKE